VTDQPAHDAVANLEDDETIPPRPEEEIADALRAEAEAEGAREPDATNQPGAR